MKQKVDCSELSLEITLLGLSHIVKATPETWQNPCILVNSTLAGSFHQQPCWEMNVMLKVNFVFSGNNKDQLRDFYNYLNLKMITTINTLDGSTLSDNLITSHQVDYMSSVLISAEAVENNQEHLAAKKAGSIGSLVYLLFVLKKP